MRKQSQTTLNHADCDSDIELVLDRGFGPKVELLFAPSEAARVRALVKAIRKAIDTSCVYQYTLLLILITHQLIRVSDTTPIAHAWVAFYPEDTHLVPEKTEAGMSAPATMSCSRLTLRYIKRELGSVVW